tara:strand:+ start:2368 stop:4986 length:2619 start_codon:yes stop_codon:yes gene_type:complete
MGNTILIKGSNTSSEVPSSLTQGTDSGSDAATEIAINRADGKLFYLNDSDSVTEFTSSVSGNTFGGSSFKIGRDADNLLDFSTDNEITFRVSAGDGIVMKASGEIEATKFDGALEGNADTATVLATSRNFRTNLASTSTAGFTGAAACTPGVTGTLAVGNGGTGVTSMTSLKNALDDETWTFANALTASGDLTVGDDLLLNSDSAVFSMGAGADVTITHDGSTGATLASAGDFIIDCEADITLDANGGDVKLLDGGAMYGVLTNNSGQLTIKSGATSSLVLNGADVTVQDDLTLITDASVLGFGADTDTTLTHVADTGLLLNSTRQLQFNDSNSYIHSHEANDLKVVATDIILDAAGDIQLNAAGGDIEFKHDTNSFLNLSQSSGTIIFQNKTDSKSITFRDEGGSEIFRIADDDGIKIHDSGATVNTIQGSGNSFADNDTSLMTSAALLDKFHVLNADTSGNAATATALATARAIGGVNFDGTAAINLPGVNTSGNQDTSGTAAIATTVTVADESSDTSCFPLFSTGASGNLAPKSGSNLTFNSNTGTLTATDFSGKLTIGGHTVDDIDIAGEFVDSDEHLMTAAAINDRIAAAGGGASALNELSDVTYSSGDLTISSLDKIVSGAITHDASGVITLDTTGGITLKEGGGADTVIRPTAVNGKNQIQMSSNIQYYHASTDASTFAANSGNTGDANSNVRFLPFNTHATADSADEPEHMFQAPCNGHVIAVMASSNNNLVKPYDPGQGFLAWQCHLQILERDGSGGANIFGGSVDAGDSRVTGTNTSGTEIDGINHTNGEYQECLFPFGGTDIFNLVKGNHYSFVMRFSKMNFDESSGQNGTTSKNQTLHLTYIISWDETTSGSTLGDWSTY